MESGEIYEALAVVSVGEPVSCPHRRPVGSAPSCVQAAAVSGVGMSASKRYARGRFPVIRSMMAGRDHQALWHLLISSNSPLAVLCH
jgi:hypothetical protein